MSTTRGLCKVANLERPAIVNLEQLASRAFVQIDLDGSNNISLSEFREWLHHNLEVVQYLKRFVGVRLIADAQKQYDEILSRVMKEFMNSSLIILQSSKSKSNLLLLQGDGGDKSALPYVKNPQCPVQVGKCCFVVYTIGIPCIIVLFW